MTDNGACYRSHDFAGHSVPTSGTSADTALPAPDQRQGRALQPHPGRRVGLRLADSTLSDAARAATYDNWLHSYNHHRPHTGIGGEVPADRVNNLTGNYS